MSQVSSAADLTAAVRRTTGVRPPPLVGCSVTLVNDAIFVFGGRLVPTRTMVSSLYSLDLRTLVWTQLWPPSSPSPSGESTEPAAPAAPVPSFGPQARYFHSACAWGDKLVIFGGEGYGDPPSAPSNADSDPAPSSSSSAEADPPALQTLGDLSIWDATKGCWLDVGEIKVAEGVERPAPRYAHLGVVSNAVGEDGTGKSYMLVMGGQDIRNTYLHSTNVLDLDSLTWVHSGTWDRHIGTYRAIATNAQLTVVPGGPLPPAAGAEGAMGLEDDETLVQLSYSEKPRLEKPEPLLLFSNFNFTQVRRDLDLVTSPLSSSSPLTPHALSSLMSGPSLPPGLRFPNGTIIGRHLLIFGTFLSQVVNNFSIWALDLGPGGGVGAQGMVEEGRGERMGWTRIDPGQVLARGSWNRAVGWRNNVVVLGDRERDIAADYDHRQTNFSHVAFVDLEAHGVYQPPPRPLPPLAQSFGLLSLSQPFLADFEIICSDGKRLGCSRKVLEDRWSWFRAKVEEFKARASGVLAAQQKRAADAQAESEVGSIAEGQGEQPSSTSTPPSTATGAADEARLTPRTLNLPEPCATVQAFLQYLYTLTLCTPLQLQLPVLSSLLVFAKTYDEPNLRALVVHALHELLSREGGAAPAVYEAATLGGCTALQIRALKVLMATPRSGGGASLRPPQSRQGVSASSSSPAPSAASSSSSTPTQVPSSATTQKSRSLPSGRSRAIPSSPTSLHTLPSSPPPDSPLPYRPVTPPREHADCPHVVSSKLSSPVSPSNKRLSSRSTSSSVAIPSPDPVPPVPVPVWTTFGPSSPPASFHSPGRPRRSTSTSTSSTSSASLRRSAGGGGYYCDVPNLVLGSDDEDASSIGSRRSMYTFATSVRSRSSSLGSHVGGGGGKESTGPPPHAVWGMPLETQREEEEPISPVQSRSEPSTVAEVEADRGGEGSELGRSRWSLASASGSGTRHPAEDQGGKETWHPMFFDVVRSTGSMRNPLSTRKATAITPELLAKLAAAEDEAKSSQPRPTGLVLPEGAGDCELFAHPRPAPRPSLSSSVASDSSSGASLFLPPSSSSALDARRHTLDAGTFALLNPRPPRSPFRRPPPRTPAASTSNRSSTSTSSSLSTQESTPTLHSPSSSSGHLVSPHEAPELQTPPLPSDSRFGDAAASSSTSLLAKRRPSLPASLLSVRGHAHAHKSPVLVPPSIVHSNATLASSSPSSPPPRRTSSLFHHPSTATPSSASTKQRRHAAEVELGTKILRAAGASEQEIQLRARSVGWQVLRAREQAGPGGLGMGMGKGGTSARGEYEGGAELCSKFSVD
ncbi:hypothetical protein JCM5296_006755 [Sporobolomyces johnsonii]